MKDLNFGKRPSLLLLLPLNRIQSKNIPRISYLKHSDRSNIDNLAVCSWGRIPIIFDKFLSSLRRIILPIPLVAIELPDFFRDASFTLKLVYKFRLQFQIGKLLAFDGVTDILFRTEGKSWKSLYCTDSVTEAALISNLLFSYLLVAMMVCCSLTASIPPNY
jgi:hypothetical protein